MKATLMLCVSLLVALTAAVSPGQAEPVFVNGLALSGDLDDKAHESRFRVGYFSDIYYDPNRNEWWALSDRGPGGGVLSYVPRVQRFVVDIHPVTGAISRFRIVETVQFRNKLGEPLDGIAPGRRTRRVQPGQFLRSGRSRRAPGHRQPAGVRRVRPLAVRVPSRRNADPRLQDPGEPQAGQRRRQLQFRRRRRHGPADQSRLRGACHQPGRCLCLRHAAERDGGRRWWQRVLQPHRQVRHRDRHRGRPVRLPDGSRLPGPWHFRARRRERGRLPRAGAEQPRHRRGRGGDSAQQEGLPHQSGGGDRRQRPDA